MIFFKWMRGGLAGLVILSLGGMVWRWQQIGAVRGELVREQERSAELAALHRKNEQLLKLQVSAAELTNLRADHEAVSRLRGEIEEMKKREAAVPRLEPPMSDTAATVFQAAVAPPEKNWKYAGTATPAAALETALWAGSAGQFDAMAATLVLGAEARTKVERWLAQLPAEERSRYSSPEKLIATLAAKDIPEQLRVIGAVGDAEEMKVTLETFRTDQAVLNTKQVTLALRRYPEGWRIIVPPSAVDRYRARLKGP